MTSANKKMQNQKNKKLQQQKKKKKSQQQIGKYQKKFNNELKAQKLKCEHNSKSKNTKIIMISYIMLCF